MMLMPLMHSENVNDVRLSVEMNEKVVEQATKFSDEATIRVTKYGLKSAKEHLEPVELFGRYPSRNNVLGRLSSAEET